MSTEKDATLRQPSSQAGVVDAAAINLVIVDLEEKARNGGIADAYDFESWAAKLQAALARPASSEPASGEAVAPIGYVREGATDELRSGRLNVTLWSDRNHFADVPVYTQPADPVKVADGWRAERIEAVGGWSIRPPHESGVFVGDESNTEGARVLRTLAKQLSDAEAATVASGTFNCPVCGKDSPHRHSRAEIARQLAATPGADGEAGK